MATNVVGLSNDGLEKQPSVNKKEKYGQSARKVHKRKEDSRRIAAKQFLLGIASNVNSQIRPTSIESEVRLLEDNEVEDNQCNVSNSTELAAKLGQQSLANSFGNDAVVQSTSECKIPPSRYPVVRSFSNIESPSQRRKVMVHAKWNTYAEGSSLIDFPTAKSISSKARYSQCYIINIWYYKWFL